MVETSEREARLEAGSMRWLPAPAAHQLKLVADIRSAGSRLPSLPGRNRGRSFFRGRVTQTQHTGCETGELATFTYAWDSALRITVLPHRFGFATPSSSRISYGHTSNSDAQRRLAKYLGR